MGSSSSKVKQKSRPSNARNTAVINPADKVMLQLKMTRDELKASINRYERVATIEHTQAKKFYVNGDKRRALYCLKRERAQQSQIDTVQGMLDNIQSLIDTVDFANVEREVVETLQVGKNELQRLNKMLNIDDIEQLMSDTAETLAEADEINEVIRAPIVGVEQDNDALLHELEELVGADPLQSVQVPNHPLPSLSSKTKASSAQTSANKVNVHGKDAQLQKLQDQRQTDHVENEESNVSDDDELVREERTLVAA